MHTRQTSRRYARAWFDLARERGVLAAADADALALEQVSGATRVPNKAAISARRCAGRSI